MALDEPPWRSGRRKALKICPMCSIKLLLEARHTMYAHMTYHAAQSWRHNEPTHRCGRRGCRKLFSDREQFIDHMLNTHSPVLMVPSSSKTYERAYHQTAEVTRREIERAPMI